MILRLHTLFALLIGPLVLCNAAPPGDPDYIFASPTPSEPGCPSGWYLLYDRCFTLAGYGDNDALTFRNADAACQAEATLVGGQNGHLAQIAHDAINSLVTSFLKILPKDVWIGLYSNSTGYLKWIDTDLRYGYENFARGQPSLDLNGDVCIKMLNDPANPGEWVSVFCENEYSAYMCQMDADPKWDPNDIPISRCSDPGYQSYFLSCYKLVRDVADFETAKATCEAEGATLASFPDKYELAFAETVLHFNRLEGVWLGLERDTEGQYKWIDGYPLTYTDWYRNEPTDDGCALMNFNGWYDDVCTDENYYFCKTTQEVLPTPEPPGYGYCPDGWHRIDDQCYYFPDEAGTDWDTANYICQSTYSGSTLASVHSDEESLFLRSQATIDWGSPYSFWIGLEMDSEGYYDWKDNTLIDYQNWRGSEGQPDITWPDNDRSCAFMPPESFEWHDDTCGTTKRFACKRPISYSEEPGCPDGWYLLDQSCFTLMGYSPDTQKTFYEADQECAATANGGHLATITSPGINALITSFLKILPSDVWIGLHNNNGTINEFRWIDDNSAPTDYNWAPGQPSLIVPLPTGSPIPDPLPEACVKMFNDPNMPGEWADVYCEGQENAYMCMSPPDPNLPANPPIVSRCGRPDYQSYYLSCYKFVETPTTYEMAKAACIADSAELASFPDRYELAFGTTVLYANGVQDVWLGMERDAETGQLGWVDGWPLTYTNWAASEPNGQDCVIHSRDDWMDVPCQETHAYFCKYTQETQPTVDPNPAGYCPSDWVRNGTNCYKFENSFTATDFDTANYNCQSLYGGTLASVHTHEEGDFIRTRASDVYGASYPLWLGLMADQNGNYAWRDGSLLDYENWNNDLNYPNNDCGFMLNDGQWGTDSCGTNKRYVCKTPLFGTTGGCPDGWYKLIDKCYALFGRTGDDAKTYDQAESACRVFPDGTLASIQEQAQQSLLTSVMKATTGDIWIGLNNRGFTGEWHWQDGSEFDYTNWNPGQPDSGSEVCGKMHNDPNSPGKWIDVFCSDTNAYLCQRPVDLTLPENPPLVSSCGEGWQSYFGSCFKVHTEPLSYGDAKARCEAYFADATFLSSMKDRYEQAFTEVLFYIDEIETGWFGLERNGVTGKHEYANGWPVTFTNWAMEEPSGDGCVAQVNMDTMAYWEDTDCAMEKPYLCKYTLESIPPVPTPDPYGYCPNGWLERSGYCYKFDTTRSAQTWDGAQYTCQTDFGSSLASIQDMAENDFIMQNAMDAWGPGNIWIGLQRNDFGYFDWADRSFVLYENWGPNQPNGRDVNENCIEMQVNSEGVWNDDDCYDSANFVCKMPTLGAEGGCPQDWYKLDRKCYKLEGVTEPKTWSEAQAWCSDPNNAIGDGALATVFHPGLQSFLTAISKAFPVDIWIGLYTDNESENWMWADGTELDYTAWGAGQPDGDVSRWNCAKMLNDPDMPGLWNDVACDDGDDAIAPELNAFLCQSNLDPTLPGNPPIVSKCGREGYQSYFESCFRVYSTPMSFADARAACQADTAELASITDRYEEAFIKTVQYNNRFNEMWIGMTNGMESGAYEWVDGWPVTFTSWGSNEPSGEGCIVLTSEEYWDDISCNNMRPFICKYTDELQPPEPTPNTGYCPRGWERLGDSCFLFDESLSARSFDAASYECQSRYGAHLASIHSTEEMEFVRTRAGAVFAASTIWIGMQRWNDLFRWTDLSLVDYVNWNEGQPGMDNCIEMDIDSDGVWTTDNCNDNSAFICKTPVFGEGGGCPDGWYKLRERCYKLGGMTEATRKTWQDAHADCQMDGGENGGLASIQVYGIQSLLTAILKGVDSDVWIGLNNLEGDFQWVDQTPVVYTNWAPGQPDSGDGVCVKLGNDVDYYPGAWVDVYCNQENAFLCQTVVDPSLPGNPDIPSLCGNNYQSYFQSCMRVITEPMTYSDAQAFCASDNAMLASLEDRYEQAFVEVTTLNNEVNEAWIGLMADSETGRYMWTDQWPLTYTKWAMNEPSRTTSSGGCVALNHMYEGAWVDSDCSEMKPFICKYTQKQRPTPEPVEMGYCPDGWESYGGSCYRFRDVGTMEWDEAQYDCQSDYGSHLVYIHDQAEAQWVANQARGVFGSSVYVWMGLKRDLDTDIYGWSNQDLVDYVNWASAPSMQGACGEMLTSNAHWREAGCTTEKNVVCKMQQLGPVGGCPDGWYKLLNKCYRLGGALDGTEPLTWQSARTACGTAAGGHLAQVFNKGLQAFLTAILKGLEGDVWIGLSTVGQTGEERPFVWDDGTPLDYENWTPGQPDGNLNEDNCVKMLNDPEYPGTWNDIVCEETNPYLCEGDLDPTMPANPPIVSRCLRSDYQSYISNCFKLVMTPMTYEAASEFCASEATELAFFSDRYEQAFIQTQLYANELGAVWLGMSQDESGAYAWDSNWPLEWTNWGMNQPTNEGCLAFTDDPAWETHDCEMAMPFVCKLTIESTPTVAPEPEGNCPSGWMSWGTSCYYIQENAEYGTWDDSQYRCQTNRGSHLVSIHSDDENMFIQEQATLTWGKANVWIGLDRNLDNYHFEWSDRSVVRYVNWVNGEPNGGNTDNCIEFNSETGTWADEDCTDIGRYICKLPQTEGVPPPESTTRRLTEIPPTGEPQTGLSTGEIAGIAVGAAVGLLVVLFLIYACTKDSKKPSAEDFGGSGGTNHQNKAYGGDDEDSD